jgi:putative colanic acid biosynthesis UDP-glucose lipid carrier transferase
MQRLRYSKYLKITVILLDIVIIAGVFVYFFKQRNPIYNIEANEQNLLSIVLLSLFWVLLSSRTKLYNVSRNLTYTLYLERYFSHIVIFLFGIILLGKVSNNDFIKSERFYMVFTLFLILLTVKSLLFFFLKYLRIFGGNFRNIMFLGEKTSSSVILEDILKERKDYGFRIFKFQETEKSVENIKKFWSDYSIHTLFLNSENTGLDSNTEALIFAEAEMAKVKIILIPSIVQDHYFKYDLNYIEAQPILTPTKFPLQNQFNYFYKRVLDIVLSSIVLLFIGIWLFPILALGIKLSSKGPVFFKQKRYGYHDEVFYCWKFRTMVVNDESSTKTTLANDIRITKFGRFLRKTSLDELPQFINVLLGDMSVVGPRPHMLLVDDYYKPIIGRYSVRSMVKPGITGLAQVSGYRGDQEDNMEIQMQKRILADAFYVKNWSMVLDGILIVKTVFLMIFGDKNAK